MCPKLTVNFGGPPMLNFLEGEILNLRPICANGDDFFSS